jgi:hypothetical protein
MLPPPSHVDPLPQILQNLLQIRRSSFRASVIPTWTTAAKIEGPLHGDGPGLESAAALAEIKSWLAGSPDLGGGGS